MWIETRTKGIRLDLADRHHFEQQVRGALSRYASRIQGTIVYLRDVNGPRGGLDQKCRIVVGLARSNRIVVSGTGTELLPLIKRTAERTRFALRRHLKRRRSGLRRQRYPSFRQVVSR